MAEDLDSIEIYEKYLDRADKSRAWQEERREKNGFYVSSPTSPRLVKVLDSERQKG